MTTKIVTVYIKLCIVTLACWASVRCSKASGDRSSLAGSIGAVLGFGTTFLYFLFNLYLFWIQILKVTAEKHIKPTFSVNKD